MRNGTQVTSQTVHTMTHKHTVPEEAKPRSALPQAHSNTEADLPPLQGITVSLVYPVNWTHTQRNCLHWPREVFS